ncbi:IS5 family transposase [Nitrospirillum sp. BR 11752]|uniref:IS5 family transposase n=1 Tax=Nitrospirillum sp. BR 11752 TaxID=3104293 RepID=UPI002EC35841|nr:IS5 family transposase [Nitrospirillum sp. BR 11752]
MSTRMTEEDWEHTLSVFRACLPRRGRKAGDDRLFLEAMHFFTVENVRWRALPEALRTLELGMEALRPAEQGGRVRGLFRHAGGDERVGSPDPDVRLHHRSRPRLGSGRKRGQQGQGLGRSRGGFTTKIHAKADSSGDIIAFDLTGGEASDARHFETLLDIGPDITPRAALGDKGYSSKANRAAARVRGIVPVIPYKANEKNKPVFFAKTLYKARSRIEQGFGRIKRFKRVALRCEKTAQNFRSIVSFAAGLCLIKFVHTT